MSERGRTLVRAALVALAVPNLYTGLWAVVAPHKWYESFPGIGPNLISAEPPFSNHLAIDAGAGFLATGVLVLLAALWYEKLVVQVALITYLVHSIPHFMHHLTSSAPGTVKVLNVALLGMGVALPAVLLALTRQVTRPMGAETRDIVPV